MERVTTLKTLVYKVERWNPEPNIIDEAAQAIRSGKLVAFPTETVYGLGANGLDDVAVRSIFAAKGRPADNPLILHFASPDAVDNVAYVNERARLLMDVFWPGPLTLVLPVKPIVPHSVTAGLETVAVRMPSHPVAMALIKAAGVPIAAPSANKSGRPSPTEAASVLSDIGDGVDIILDGGATDVGLESTVIDVTGPSVVLLRAGGMPVERIEEVVGDVVLVPGEAKKKRSPGTRYRHYAPLVPLLLWKDDSIWQSKDVSGKKIGYIGIKEPPVTVPEKIIFKSPEYYAHGLFAAFRTLEKKDIDIIVAEWPERVGIGLALRDRLCRAAGQE
jgi:L-threonylcarbamoyladenylate synthase